MSKGGGGGGGMFYPPPTINNSNTNTSNNIPDWLTNASRGGIDYAAGLLKNPGQAYGGQLTAGLNNTQNYAGGLFRNMIGSTDPYYNAAMNATKAGMQKGLDYKQGLNDIGGYMNPYINNVVKSVQDYGKQNLEKSLTQTADQAISANAFGGSRHGVQEGIATAQNNRDMNRQIADLMSSGYDKATNLLGQDIANNNDYLNRQLSGGTQMANIGTQRNQTNASNANNLMNWGNQQQQTQQNQLSAQYQEWLRQQGLPYQALQAYNQTVQGAPHSTSGSSNTTSIGYAPQQQQSSSPWMNALGAGLGGLSLMGTLSNPATAMGRGFGLLGGALGSARNMFGPHDVYGAMGNRGVPTYY